MKTTTFLGLAALALPALAADDLSGFPTCAQTCAATAVSGSACQLTDPSCVCSSVTIGNAFLACIAGGCSTADQQTAATAVTAYCATVGISFGSSSASTASNTTTTAAASGSKTNGTASATHSVLAYTGAASMVKGSSALIGGMAVVGGLVSYL